MSLAGDIEAANTRKNHPYRWVAFAIVASNGIVLYFHYAWGATLSGYHAVDWNLNARQLGLLTAFGFFSYALMQIPGGYLTDWLGARKVLSTTVGILAIGTLLLAYASNFAEAAVGRTLIGLSSGVIMLPSLKVLAHWFRIREFAVIQGAFILLANIGPLLGTLPLALAAERWGWRASMAFVAALTALLAGATWLLLRNEPAVMDLPSHSDREQKETPGDLIYTARRPSLRTGFRAWSSIPTLWATSVIFFATFGSLQAFQALWAGPLLRHVHQLSAAETGRALLMFTIGTGLGPILFGFISDRLVKARKPVVVFAALSQLGLWTLFIMTFAQLSLPLIYAIFVTLSALSGGVLVGQVMIKELCPPHLFGTIYGIHNGAGFYGTGAIQLVTGSILSLIGPTVIEAEPIYSAHAYTLALSPILGLMLLAALLSLRLGETLGPRSSVWPATLLHQ